MITEYFRTTTAPSNVRRIGTTSRCCAAVRALDGDARRDGLPTMTGAAAARARVLGDYRLLNGDA